MVQSMRDLERTWNSKFSDPWTFFNDAPFNEEYKRKTQAETKAKCFYGNNTPRHKHPQRLTFRPPNRIDTQRTLGRPLVDK